MSMDHNMSQIKQDLAKIEEQLAVWETQRIELTYQAESIPYVRLQQAEQGKREAEEMLNSATEQYSKADFFWRQNRGYNDYLERAELFGANAALNKRLELASLGQEEQLTELDLSKVTFRAILERLCSELEKDYIQSSEANRTMDKRLSDVSVELNTLRQTEGPPPISSARNIQGLNLSLIRFSIGFSINRLIINTKTPYRIK